MAEIVWEDPPRRKRENSETLAFVELLKEHPKRWAIYDRRYKSSSMTSTYRRNYPGTEWTSRSNGDGTVSVYARWVGES